MISELNQEEFYMCNHLILPESHMEVKAIIEGTNPGRIFVDNTEFPTSGLIWLGNNDGFFFVGDEKNKAFNDKINNLINTKILPDAKRFGLNWFEGIGYHQLWDDTIKQLFQQQKLESWKQRVYMLEESNYTMDSEPILNREYTILKINKENYYNCKNTCINLSLLKSNILESWSSLEHFFDKGIGYMITYKNKIVSVCLSGFVADNIHSIHIETVKEQEGKSLAQKIAHCFVKECFQKGLKPYWDCTETNYPSVAIANKLNFKMKFTYEVYGFRMRE
ncbi:GNAT family N-acetyltransferase [Evansella sp. AB-P1]|uniref:GNAT family N-acetyltransferase n=1 Tax=Evansella sp. AB-P1 TaxID=3037653 RepID=UPI00241CBC3F|nr:GNAT family N-acetyltransferase [Evansella sp. AB-P1]MDG5788579.1 GNAT family N-acetyltransferase [Evansella sp. AB-P1]